MLCKNCSHCGLCPGDGSFKTENNLYIENDFAIPLLTENNSFSENEIGIAFDIGTTTIASAAFSLRSGKKIMTLGEQNLQTEFGSDVIARISFAMQEDGFDILHKTVLIQINDIVKRMLMNITADALSKRNPIPVLKKIVIAGNTVMQSFVYGQKTDSLAVYPFTVENYFGESVKASFLFNQKSVIPPETEIYFAPVISAFVGGDAVCAFVDCRTQCDYFVLADIGTNCEMLLCNGEKIYAASSSAGPAFEGQGISCGMRGSEGAVVSVEKKSSGFQCRIIGGGNAIGICGSGIVNAVSVFLKNNLINREGCFLNPEDKKNSADENKISSPQKIILIEENVQHNQKEISVTQKDVRNLQLAKGSVCSGLKILLKSADISTEKQITFFTAGAFGNQINSNDMKEIKMIPPGYDFKTVNTGNAALGGASLLLLNEKIRAFAKQCALSACQIDLSLHPDFQKEFISSLNF